MTMNQPRHGHRGRPSACPGSCNPLNAHHHHHHHRHHRQKCDMAEVPASQTGTTVSRELDPISLFKYFDLDISAVAATRTTDVKSSTTDITLIKVSSESKVSRSKETAFPPTIRQLETLCGEPSTSRKPPPLLRTIELTPAPRTITVVKKPTVRTLIRRAGPGILDGVRSAITRGLNGLTPKRAPSLRPYLTIVMIYAVIHVLLAILTWRTSTYQLFLSSQVCGIIAILMRRIIGTILL